MRLLLCLVLAVVSSCAKPCARADVARVIADCRAEPGGSPTYLGCVTARLRPPDDFDRLQPAVEACNETGSGAFFACLAAQGGTCLDGGIEAAMSQCSSSAGPGISGPTTTRKSEAEQQACSTACMNAERTCSLACPTTSWADCATCDERCARTYRQCSETCW